MITKSRIAGLLTLLVCAGLVLFGVFVGLMPQLATAESTLNDADSASSINDNYRIQLAMLQQADKDSSEVTRSLEELRKALPDTADTASWFSQLYDLEKKFNGNVALFEVKNPLQEKTQQPAPAPADGKAASGDQAQTPSAEEAAATPSGPLPVPISLQFATKGDEKDVAGFIHEVQTGSRLFVVTSAQAIFDKDKKIWRAQLDGNLYVLADAK